MYNSSRYMKIMLINLIIVMESFTHQSQNIQVLHPLDKV